MAWEWAGAAKEWARAALRRTVLRNCGEPFPVVLGIRGVVGMTYGEWALWDSNPGPTDYEGESNQSVENQRERLVIVHQ